MTARTPEQGEAPRTVEDGPAGSREVRRRLTFGVAGDIADMRAALSPWQRAYEAWRAAGLSWGHGAPPRERAASRNAVRAGSPPDEAASAEPKPEPAAEQPEPAAEKPKPTAKKPKPSGKKPKPAAKKPKPAKPVPGDVLVAGSPKPAPKKAPKPAQRPALWRRLRTRAAIGAGLTVVAAGTVFAVAQRAEAPTEPGIRGPIAADELFALDPAAATDGLVQDLTAIASTGSVVVAAGTEGDGAPGRERARFLVSTDRGRTWTLAEIRTQDGSTPPPGETPHLVSGWSGHWTALGRAPGGGTVEWTSEDAKVWTRRPPGAGFTPSDQVNDLVYTDRGFIAVGGSKGRAVAWTSGDGRTWQRVDGIKGITGFDRAAVAGNVVMAHGTYARKVTEKKGRKKVTRTVRADALWRSVDEGRTWTSVKVPQAQGSYGPMKGLVVAAGGFATVREGKQTSGRKKHRKTKRSGVLFTSADGLKWRVAGRFGGSGIERLGDTDGGFAVIVRGAKGARAILRSADGRTWQPGGSIPAGVRISGLARAGLGGVSVTGRQGDDAYLHGVDLRTVPGAVHAERSVGSLAAGPALSVAVGSTNGGAAIWTAPDGLRWSRARIPGTPGRLSDAVHGTAGWLAVGRASGTSPAPLAMTSQDGLAWEKTAFPAGPAPVAAATGPSGYVVVGPRGSWRSTDLRTWKRAGLDGVPADVTATSGAYVAVGARGEAPAVWTSPDAAKWTAAELPPGLTAPLTQVTAHGDTLVAISASAIALVSTDAGATWTQRNIGPGLAAAAVTSTPRGFVLTASTNDDGAVLASADGTTWRRLDVGGLTGPGEQRLTTLTTMGGTVLATGTDGGAPTLWRTPVPK
ncbi:hypothetical protein [Actinomadura latina]|uniref:Uncharacterized protein n=1 Tax=Actinomadura latina TaxID=163603 RepID=A0A846Z2N5_9ACTN|nr:hypothetical protein [Actinomadura latina]NKZ04643.1 hypothetical protein [Actinomadura latina]